MQSTNSNMVSLSVEAAGRRKEIDLTTFDKFMSLLGYKKTVVPSGSSHNIMFEKPGVTSDGRGKVLRGVKSWADPVYYIAMINLLISEMRQNGDNDDARATSIFVDSKNNPRIALKILKKRGLSGFLESYDKGEEQEESEEVSESIPVQNDTSKTTPASDKKDYRHQDWYQKYVKPYQPQ